MKITREPKFTFQGEDFEGEYDESDILGEILSVDLVDPPVEKTGKNAVDPTYRPSISARFQHCTTEQEIDRLCAAAKIALREIQKQKT